MLALSTLERPHFPLYSAKIDSNYDSATAPTEQPVHASELLQILDHESLDILSEIQILNEDFDHFTSRIATVSDLDDIEYRCVATQHRLLSFDYKSLMFTEAESPTIHTETQSQILRGCCRLAMLIYFGEYLLGFQIPALRKTVLRFLTSPFSTPQQRAYGVSPTSSRKVLSSSAYSPSSRTYLSPPLPLSHVRLQTHPHSTGNPPALKPCCGYASTPPSQPLVPSEHVLSGSFSEPATCSE